MTQVALFDTALGSDNLGDEIIMEAVKKHLRGLYPQGDFFHVPTHCRLSRKQRQAVAKSPLAFVGGTNLLCAHWLKAQWKLGPLEALRIGQPVLMGVGWQHYQRRTDALTAWLWRRVLGGGRLHAVRDGYTLARLRDMGITNALNTACPTMWELTEAHCAGIPACRADEALVTLTHYRGVPEYDRTWLAEVLARYKQVYFWPQMEGDIAYVQQLAPGRLHVLPATLAAYDSLLRQQPLDVIGTRLHGGIRALQHGRRTLIIEVDNRAAEIARDTGLPTVAHDDVAALRRWIEQPVATTLAMPWDAIARWKAHYSG